MQINFDRKIGKIKPMHATGQPPFVGGFNKFDFSPISWLQKANVPYSRLHDVGGAFGSNRFVDIPNIFRDFDADENDPDSYDFVFTDVLIAGMYEYGIEPMFRLGVTIENQANIKAYRIHPPKDFAKWARICEHIVRHYNEGWADGFRFGITYWEIWNEPDNEESIELNNMWKGTAEQYFDLYAVTSKHLRACFGDSIKIGGYSCTGLYLGYMEQSEKYKQPHEITHWEERAVYHTKFLQGFLERVKRDNLPLDFFSHHSYMDVRLTTRVQKYAERLLEEAGYPDIEIHLNEWNTDRTRDTRGTTKAAADVAAMMMAMHATKMSVMCYYDARVGISVYGGLFNPMTYEPYCTYYSFKAFGKLYALGDQVEVTGDLDNGLYAMAATNGTEQGILIANIGEDKEIETNLGRGYTVYLIDEKHMMTKKRLSVKSFKLKQYETLYLEKNS